MRNLIIIGFIFIVFFLVINYNFPLTGVYPEKGIASWYTADCTATGENFDENSLTCAMRRRDFGGYYKVCNIENKKCVIVRQNNFGPTKPYFRKGRIIDLSKAAFSQIADLEQGLAKIKISDNIAWE